jgi:hypothetical protein
MKSVLRAVVPFLIERRGFQRKRWWGYSFHLEDYPKALT